MINKIDLVDEEYSQNNKDGSDPERMKEAINKHRKQVQDDIIAGLDLDSLHASVLSGQKSIDQDAEDEN